MTSIRLKSPAKINIFLRVLGRRADNYHDIETLFQAIELYDELIIRKSKGLSRLVVKDHPDLENSHNLVFKALRWLEHECGERFDVEIELRKRIPVAAGLGGGSSNAAATLVAIRELFDLKGVSVLDMQRGAALLGADVPFFLVGGTAIGLGIGEVLKPVKMNLDFRVLLINPGFSVSTAEIFSAFSKTLTVSKKEATLSGLFDQGVELSKLLINDLQDIAESIYPEIKSIRETFVDQGLTQVLMTGSGPTIFGLGESAKLESLFNYFSSKYRAIMTSPSATGILID